MAEETDWRYESPLSEGLLVTADEVWGIVRDNIIGHIGAVKPTTELDRRIQNFIMKALVDTDASFYNEKIAFIRKEKEKEANNG